MASGRLVRFGGSKEMIWEHVGSVSRASAAGKPLESILELGARGVLWASEADRVGVWAEASDGEGFWKGVVVLRKTDDVPENWKRLRPESDLPKEVRGSRAPVAWNAISDAAAPALPVLDGMRRVLWFPLWFHAALVGVIVVARESGRAFASQSAMKGLAAELVLAVTEARERRSLAQARQELRARDGLAAANRVLLDSSTEALLILTRAGGIRQASRRARDLLRLPELRTPDTFLSTLFAEASRPGVDAWIQQAAAGGHPEPRESVLGSGFTVRLHHRGALPREGQFLVCLEEGSVAQRALPRGDQLEAELRSLLDSVHAGVLLLDPCGRLRFANARFAQSLGVNSRELERAEDFEKVAKLVQDRLRVPESFAGPWRRFRMGHGEPVRDELELMRPSRRLFERVARPVLDAQGNRLGWLEIYRDITSQRQIQSKMLQTEKMAALGQLVSGIAHELNNPLTAIMGYTQLLLGHGLRPNQLAEAKKIYDEAERARRIVKNLLYFAREAQPERSRVDLNELVERTLALRSYELKVENIVVECDLAPELPPTMADPYQLQQVILNLLVNAEQAILQGRGHGHIWIRTRPIRDNRLAFEVADDGPGVSPEIASRIFDPFFTTKPPGVGTGLGLSIVYGIVQQHGGEVSLESSPGGGAKFVVELPIVAVAEKEAVSAEALRSAAEPDVPPGRILVVEDESTVAQLIADVLREEGHQVDAVLDSQEGLNRIARTRYDLVVCDLRMPRLDGPAFYEALVRAGSPVQNRIIFITGDTLAQRTLEFLEPHGLPYLAKPFLVEELKLAVNRMLEKRASGPPLAPPGGGARGERTALRHN